jgi:hypothetical protein
MDTAYVRCADKEYLIVACENGSLGVINYGSPSKPIFKHGMKDDLSFVDSYFEHSDAIVALDVYPDGAKAAAEFKKKTPAGDKINPKDESLVLSADRDGNVILWTVSAGSEQVLEFIYSVKVSEPLTRAKFLSSERILATSTHGSIWSILLLRDSQGNTYLEKPIAVYRNSDLSAIWDFAIISNPARQQQAEYDVLIANDSGEVKHVMINHLQIESSSVLIVSAQSNLLTEIRERVSSETES